MAPVFKIILAYLLLMSIYGFVQMGADKRRAINGQRRIPERTLFAVAILGGSLGSLLGMYTFRHKTKHLSFVIGMPAILVVQLLLALGLKQLLGM